MGRGDGFERNFAVAQQALLVIGEVGKTSRSKASLDGNFVSRGSRSIRVCFEYTLDLGRTILVLDLFDLAVLDEGPHLRKRDLFSGILIAARAGENCENNKDAHRDEQGHAGPATISPSGHFGVSTFRRRGRRNFAFLCHGYSLMEPRSGPGVGPA